MSKVLIYLCVCIYHFVCIIFWARYDKMIYHFLCVCIYHFVCIIFWARYDKMIYHFVCIILHVYVCNFITCVGICSFIIIHMYTTIPSKVKLYYNIPLIASWQTSEKPWYFVLYHIYVCKFITCVGICSFIMIYMYTRH